jgi:NtrC-family two-component system response regulator AlgB
MPSLPLKILIVDNEPSVRKDASIVLEKMGHEVSSVSNGRDAMRALSRESIDLALVDLKLGKESGMGLMPRLLGTSPGTRIVLTSKSPTVAEAVEAVQQGAADVLEKPFQGESLKALAEKVSKLRERDQDFLRPKSGRDLAGHIVELFTQCTRMKQALAVARYMAEREVIILIQGEPGSGRALLAQAIHTWSPEPKGSFIKIDARTQDKSGANWKQMLSIARSRGDTVYQEEIHRLGAPSQEALARCLEEGKAQGRHSPSLIASTSVNLGRLVEEGRFHPGLAKALQGMQLDLPSLRDRREDVPLLANAFLGYFGQLRCRRPQSFSSDAMLALHDYSWPGNLPELREVVDRAVALCQEEHVGLVHLPLKVSVRPFVTILETKPEKGQRRKTLRA